MAKIKLWPNLRTLRYLFTGTGTYRKTPNSGHVPIFRSLAVYFRSFLITGE